jgi:hypothetical protein
MSNKPLQFTPDQIVINDQQTRQILNFFYRDAAPPLHINHVSHQLKSIAQTMLIDGIQATKAQSALINGLRDIIPVSKNIALGASAAKTLCNILNGGYNFHNNIQEAKSKNTLSPEDFQNGKIAHNVKVFLANQYGRVVEIAADPFIASREEKTTRHAMQDDPAFKNLPENMQKAVLAYTNQQDQTKLETHQTAQNTPNQFGISPALKASLDETQRQTEQNTQNQGRSV